MNDKLFRRNESENNEIVSKIFIGIAAFVFIMWLFCMLGIFNWDNVLATVFFLICIVLFIIPVIMIYVFHMHKSYMKYLLISILSIVMGASYCIFTFQMVILFIIPCLVAMLYMDEKLLYFSGIMNLCVITMAHIITIFIEPISIVEPFTTAREILRFGLVPRVMQFSVCFIILMVLSKRINSYFTQFEEMNSKKSEIYKSEAEDEFANVLNLLTERERDVFIQMLLGKTNIQIADTLCLSMGTVKNYISSIYDKLGTRERTYLILQYGRFADKYIS